MKTSEIKTPAYVLDEAALLENLGILRALSQRTGVKILLAQKAFSMFAAYPVMKPYLSGTTASGLYEARLGHECFGKETHVFSPAYTDREMKELCGICDHISFNSFTQLEAHRKTWEASEASVGIRVNPEFSTQEGHAIYDPCAPGSRMGVVYKVFKENEALLSGVEGLHLHTLCEQNSDALVSTFAAFEEKFGAYLREMKWLNLGGGHHITKREYDMAALDRLIYRIKDKYGVEVYLEPGEAVALNAGYLVTTVLDRVENGGTTLVLDTSAACHMPDVLEMPYRPPVADSSAPGELPYTYTLAGRTCLAGDIIGSYSFDRPVNIGERLWFSDMAIYSMVKNNTFNGMPLPSIIIRHVNGENELVREFGYEDFKGRLS